MLRVIMEDFFGQVSDNFISQLVVLSLRNQPNKLRQRLSQIFLCVEQMDDFGRILVEHVLHLRAVLLHALLHQLEQLRFDLLVLDVVGVLKHVERCADEQIDEVFVDAVLGPEVLDVLVHQLDEKLDALVGNHHDGVDIPLSVCLLSSFLLFL